jgi:hypothetical protein
MPNTTQAAELYKSYIILILKQDDLLKQKGITQQQVDTEGIITERGELAGVLSLHAARITEAFNYAIKVNNGEALSGKEAKLGEGWCMRLLNALKKAKNEQKIEHTADRLLIVGGKKKALTSEKNLFSEIYTKFPKIQINESLSKDENKRIHISLPYTLKEKKSSLTL